MRTTLEFQIVFSLFYGLVVGLFSYSILTLFFSIILFEYLTYAWSTLYPPGDKIEDRLLLNVVFIFGWVMSRYLFLRETGFETCIEETTKYYNSLLIQ